MTDVLQTEELGMKVAVGSTNKTKTSAVQHAFPEATLIPVSASSGVADQPFSDEETLQGAVNRAKHALEQTDADVAIGLEGGVVETGRGLFLCNWGALVTRQGEVFYAGGARIQLPDEFLHPLLSGKELGEIMEHYTRRQDIRSGEGAIGIFTNGYVNREEMFTHVAKLLAGQYMYTKA